MRILVVGPSWVGDMVMSMSLIRLIKQAHPDAKIDVLVPKLLMPLVACMTDVEQIIASPCGHGELGLAKRYRLGKQLRKTQYDQAIILPNAFKSALIPYFANIPKRSGWLGEQRYGILNDIRKRTDIDKRATPKRYAALALTDNASLPQHLPQPQLAPNSAACNSILTKLQLMPPQQPLLIICPGAEFGPAKQWPPQYFVDVAKAQIARGWGVWLLGSPKDQTIAATIAQQLSAGCHNLAGKTTLAEAVSLLGYAQAVVCHDSGLMHVALALGCNVITVYGPSDLGGFEPAAEQAFVGLNLKLTCSPCYQRQCPLKHHRCMQDLQPERVLNALAQFKPLE